MDEMLKQGLGLLGFLVVGIILLVLGFLFWNTAWPLVMLALACFVAMMAYLAWSLRMVGANKQETLYRRGSPPPEK